MLVISAVVCVVCVIVCIKHKNKGTFSRFHHEYEYDKIWNTHVLTNYNDVPL